jgi:uncharacterized protein YdaU (DUF1376 family)
MAARPDLGWYKRHPDKALAGMFELNLEQRGAYNTILDLIYSRAGNLPFDVDLIKGHLRVNSRVTKRLLDELIALDKLYIEDGVVRNRRSDIEIKARISTITAQSEGGKEGAEKRWNGDEKTGDKSSLDESSDKSQQKVEENSSKSGQKLDEFSPTFPEQMSETQTENGGNLRKRARVTYSRNSPTRAQESESESEEESTPSTNPITSGANPFDDEGGILGKVQTLGRIAGLNLTRPEKLANALDQLREWDRDGIDYASCVLPTIKSRSTANPTELVHSLKYFDSAVRKAHGLKGEGYSAPTPPRPPKPKDPIKADDGTDDRIKEFRTRLERLVGAPTYLSKFSPLHCAVDIQDDRLVRLRFRSAAEASLADNLHGDKVSTSARQIGLTSIIEELK